VATGDLIVRYDRTGAITERFSVPIGGITVVDPAGVVYDRVTYDEKIAQGMTPDQARAAAAITGAAVRLQRKVGQSFVNVLAGDPGISPHVNPEITGANGMFQWDVPAGGMSTDGLVTGV